MVPAITNVFELIDRLVVPTRATDGKPASTEPSRRLSIGRSSSLVYIEEMKVTPTLTLPSPEVRARSANDGPNVVAVRTCSPVAGSSLKTNPPDDVPNGVVATSSAVA